MGTGWGWEKSTGTGWEWDGKKFMEMELEREQFISPCHCLLWSLAVQLPKHEYPLLAALVLPSRSEL